MPTAFGYPLTDEDVAIFDRAMQRSATLQRLVEREADELIDYRAMLAIEVSNGRDGRVYGVEPRKPADRVRLYGDTGLRETVEHENDEPLA